jgi:conjugal transfer pilus assembly protein TraB
LAVEAEAERQELRQKISRLVDDLEKADQKNERFQQEIKNYMAQAEKKRSQDLQKMINESRSQQSALADEFKKSTEQIKKDQELQAPELTEEQRRELFDTEDVVKKDSGLGKMAGQAQELGIKVLGGKAKPEEAKEEEAVYIPAGSALAGVLLTGVDAPASLQAKRDPTPALVRIKHEAILPNRYRADVRECFVLMATVGDLSSERAYLRGETLSCVRKDGGVIEVKLDAYGTGEDGKAGMRGRLVTREGALIARSLAAGFIGALSDIYQPVAIQGFNTSPDSDVLFQRPDTSQAVEAAAWSGASDAMERLADYYVELAEQRVPVIEVDAGRQVDVILTRGVSLKLVDTSGKKKG